MGNLRLRAGATTGGSGAGGRATTGAGPVRGAVLAVLAVALAGYLATFGQHAAAGYSFWADGVLGNAVLALPALVCLGRAVLVPARRAVFALVGLAAAAFTAGNCVYVFHVQFLDPVPYPSLADAGYLLPYPLLLAAVLLLAVPELRGISRGTFLDGVLGALACAAAGSILVVHQVLPDLEGSMAAKVVGAAFPFADLTLTALIVGVVVLAGGRPGPTWIWLGAGVVTFAVADSLYLYRVGAGTYHVGTPLDALWAVGLNLLAVAAVLPYRPGGRAAPSPRAVLLPNVFALVGVVLLAYGSLRGEPLPVYAVVLVVVTLLVAVQRTVVGYAALEELAATHRQARTDELTQLPNRRAFEEEVQQVLTQASGEPLALMLVNLHGFRAVNETFGHHAGDELLRQIGPRLRRELREGDLVARVGGDEFGFLLRAADVAHAIVVARRVVAAVAEPFLLDGTAQNAGARAGVALSPQHGSDLTVLMRRAEAALADAREQGGEVAVFDVSRHAADERLDVAGALERHELVVFYQPQFAVEDRRLTGVEALVRWQHPGRGLIFPDTFIPLFEQAGLMGELTLEVLRVAAQDRRDWALSGLEVHLSVNLAPSALLEVDLPAAVGEILVAQGLAAADLTLEVTESAMLADVERSMRTLVGLRDLGLHLSLDDYGTGYCSLTYLRDLPLDEVKIDRSFVMGLAPGTPDAVIVASTVALGHSLGLRVVAEGVETELGFETLREAGCDTVQGYLLGRPMPAIALARLRTSSPVPG